MDCVDRALLSCRLRPFNASRCYHPYNDLCKNFFQPLVDLSVHRNGSTAYLIYAHMCVLIVFTMYLYFAHCSKTSMSSLTHTPKSFSFTIVHDIASSIIYSLFIFPFPIWMHLYFPKLNNICPFFTQFHQFGKIIL